MARRRRRSGQQARRNKSARPTGEVDDERFAEPDWVWVGDRRMFVVDYTSGGAPIGYFEDELDDKPQGGVAPPPDGSSSVA